MNKTYKTIKRFSYFFLVVLSSLCYLNIAIAQEDEDEEVGIGNLSNVYDFQALGGMESRLLPHGDDLMGDMIDKNTGGVSFEHTDVSIPGNFNIEVALRRKLSQGDSRSSPYQQGFGDWVLDIPVAYASYATSLVNPQRPVFNNGCLNEYGPMRRDATVSVGSTSQDVRFDVHAEGLVLSVPGQGLTGFPSDPKKIMDPAANWKEAPRSTDNHGRCATVVIAPDGTKYKFGLHTFRKARALAIPVITEDVTPIGFGSRIRRFETTLEKEYAVYLVTEIEDVHGNEVYYNYNDNRELTSIVSSDGRRINIAYNTTAPNTNIRNSRTISSITVVANDADNRTWRYSYAGQGLYLRTATLPDNRFWTFGTAQSGMEAMRTPVNRHYKCLPKTYSVSIKHPDGALGTFSFRETRHIKNAENLGSSDDDSDHYMRPSVIADATNNNDCVTVSSGTRPDFYRPVGWPVYRVMSLTSKRLSGSGIPTADWRFSYRNYGGGALDINYTRMVRPDGTEITYTHPALGRNHGLLTQAVTREPQHINDRARFIDRIDYTYNVTAPIFSDCTAGGEFGDTSGMCHAFKMRPATRVVQTRVESDSVQEFYTTETTYNQYGGSGHFIDFGFPNTERRYSTVNLDGSIRRNTTYTYDHKENINVIGLVKTVTRDNVQTRRYDYDNVYGRLTNEYRYNQPYASYTYHDNNSPNDKDAKGAIKTITDAEGRQILRENYKRGTPQRTRRPDGASELVTINDHGWLLDSTDAKGAKTIYSQDNMGRLTFINPPGPWNNTVINYNFSGGGATQTITRGQARETITYDELYRPILERSQALDTGWSSYINTRYRSAGQAIFVSQPSTNSNESKGVAYDYDALGRLSKESDNFAPFAEINHSYARDNKYLVEDGEGYTTTHQSNGYGGAGSGELIEITSPLNVKTRLYRNFLGKVTRARQYGNIDGNAVDKSQYYYFDSRQRVCRHRTPEGGDSLYAYDDSGYLTSYAKGISSSATNCAAPSGQSRVTLTLDALARVERTNFTDASTPDIVTTYDLNSNVITNKRGGVDWTYTFDELNHVESETLNIDGRTYKIAYTYDNSENLDLLTLPSGRVVDYNNDGLGRVLSAKSEGTFYANNVLYHASSQISSMAYGNGQVFTQTLNSRLLPERIRAVKGGVASFDLQYSYDNRRFINSINDFTDFSNNRSFSYDGLGNLKTAQGPWGSGQFEYDALGNLRVKILGGRTVFVSYDNTRNRATQNTDTDGGSRTIGYDSRGNVTTLGNLNFNYDFSDQPTSVSGSSSGSYQYDGNLKRVKASVGGKLIYNIYNAAGQLVHVDKVRSKGASFVKYKNYLIPISKSEKTDYIHASGMTIARITNDEATYLHSDLLGSPVAGTNTAGSRIWKEQYTPYGEKLIGDAANDDLGSFTGHIDDSGTGLTYMQARYYDPDIGRFLSIDPVGSLSYLNQRNTAGFNRYTYAYNNPVNVNDPDGELGNFVVGGIIGGLSEVALQVFVEGKRFREIDRGAVVKSIGVGAVSGGVGGSTAKLANRLIRTATKPQGQFSRGASVVVTEGASAAIGGAAGGAAGETANQIVDGLSDGEVGVTLDGGSILNAAKNSAVTSGAVGLLGGAVVADHLKATLGNSRFRPAFTKESGVGERAASAISSTLSVGSSFGQSAVQRCDDSGGC